MNILLIGSTGRVGTKLADYLLEDGFTVHLLVRSPEKIGTIHSGSRIFTGDVLDREKLKEAMKGTEAVFSCLSGKSTKPDYSILSSGIKTICSVMEELKIKRLMAVAGAGILDDREFGLRRNRPGYPEIFKNVSAENCKVRDYLETTNFDWTLVSCPEIPDGNRTGIYRFEPDYLPGGGSRISTGDVADFMIKNVSNENTYKKRIGVSY